MYRIIVIMPVCDVINTKKAFHQLVENRENFFVENKDYTKTENNFVKRK